MLDFKIGDILICTDNDDYEDTLVLGEEYPVVDMWKADRVYHPRIKIKDSTMGFYSERFKLKQTEEGYSRDTVKGFTWAGTYFPSYEAMLEEVRKVRGVGDTILFTETITTSKSLTLEDRHMFEMVDLDRDLDVITLNKVNAVLKERGSAFLFRPESPAVCI